MRRAAACCKTAALFFGFRPSAMKRPALKNFRRIVVKVGSSLLIDSGKGEVRASWLAALVADMLEELDELRARLRRAGT